MEWWQIVLICILAGFSLILVIAIGLSIFLAWQRDKEFNAKIAIFNDLPDYHENLGNFHYIYKMKVAVDKYPDVLELFFAHMPDMVDVHRAINLRHGEYLNPGDEYEEKVQYFRKVIDHLGLPDKPDPSMWSPSITENGNVVTISKEYIVENK